MLKKFLFLLLPLFFFLLSLGRALATDRPHFISFVNPVRGEEGWIHKQSPLDLPKLQYIEATKSAAPVTWLLRYDAVISATISGFFKDLTATDASQTLGAFLEITPKMAAAVAAPYPNGETFTAANRVFLSGYDQPYRIKLIDAYMAAFYNRFGSYPRVVGAWHIDAYSLDYLASRYSVIAAVICDEQYNTDNYRFWGGYLGSPYFPSKLNFLVPATTRENRIPIAITKWAARDPFSFYGVRSESNYSFQINDYLAMSQTTTFFEKLLAIYSDNTFNEFSQVNIGLENDYDIKAYRSELIKTYALLAQNRAKYNLKFISLADFGVWLANRYTFTNPAFLYQTTSITGQGAGKVYWYQNPFYRIGIKSVEGKTWILDFRLYNQAEAEEHYLVRNINKMLYAEINPLVDSVKYPGTALALDLDLEQAALTTSGWKVSFKAGTKELRLEPQRIVFAGLTPPEIKSPEVRLTKQEDYFVWLLQPRLPFSTTPSTLALIALLGAGLGLVLLLRTDLKFPFKVLLVAGWLTGSLATLTVVRSGLVFLYGLGFWGPNGHDAVFHLSLAEHFKRNPTSLIHPQLFGAVLKNYHFGFDWLTGLLSRFTGLSLLDLYFRLVPIILVLLLVYLSVRLLSLWRYSHSAVLLALTFIFLSGSAGFIPALILKDRLFAGESFFWANQSISLLLNPPFALSLVVILLFLYLVERRPHRLRLVEWLALSLLGGLLVQVKIYAFILLFLSLVLSKKIRLAFGVGLFGALFLVPSLGGTPGFPFVFQPLWFTRSMFESPDRLYWRQFAEAWQVYENNGIIFKLVLVNLVAVTVFFIGNLWVRLLGLIRLFSGADLTLSAKVSRWVVFLGLVFPLLFTQNVNPWNTIQFMYYSLFFLSFFTAQAAISWFTNPRHHLLSALSVIALVAISMPTTVGTLADYLTSQSASRVSLTELRALDLLRRSPPGVVVAPLSIAGLPFAPDPRPLYAYASTAYISALSGQPEYLSDTINLDITGFDYQERSKNVQRLYLTRDPLWVKRFLNDNRITYIYETPFAKIKVRQEDVCLMKIFDSGEINLLKYVCHD